MSACPACGGDVRPVWPTCRSCGALLMAPPAPVVSIGADADSAPSAAEQFFTPAVFRAPVKVDAPPSYAYTHDTRVAGTGAGSGAGAGKWIALAGMVVFVIAAVAIAWFTIRPGAAAKADTPVVLPARPPAQGLTPNLADIVRVEAESTRHTALQAVAQVGNGNLGPLAAAQSNYAWVGGSEASPDPHTVSVVQNAGNVTIAVAASNHDVCAFGQWSQNATPVYVTMAHEHTCAAVNAPTTGWSTQPGGASSDLPDDYG
jgi:hypothetical protein